MTAGREPTAAPRGPASRIQLKPAIAVARSGSRASTATVQRERSLPAPSACIRSRESGRRAPAARSRTQRAVGARSVGAWLSRRRRTPTRCRTLRYGSGIADLCRGRQQGPLEEGGIMLRSSARSTVLVALLVAAAAAPATAAAAVDPLTLVSGPSPFAAGCEGAPQTGTVYRNAEVEPWVDVNLADDNNLVGNWQQDRWSNGGASGNLSAYSLNGGTTLDDPADQRRAGHRAGQVQPLHGRQRRQRRRLRARDRSVGVVLAERRGAPSGAVDQRLRTSPTPC